MKRNGRLIVALDTPSRERALDLVRLLRDDVGIFKVGLELYTAAGPGIVRDLSDLGVDVFLDLKFHDIPSTVARAVVQAARLGVALLDLHLSGGEAMIRRAADELETACALHSLRRPLLLGVTVLTSLGSEDLGSLGIGRTPEEQVLALASLGREAGLDGVVASPREIAPLRQRFGPDWVLVTPGIRPEGSPPDDQTRTLTPRQAREAGADYLVVGRPITGSPDPREATRALLRSLVG